VHIRNVEDPDSEVPERVVVPGCEAPADANRQGVVAREVDVRLDDLQAAAADVDAVTKAVVAEGGDLASMLDELVLFLGYGDLRLNRERKNHAENGGGAVSESHVSSPFPAAAGAAALPGRIRFYALIVSPATSESSAP